MSATQDNFEFNLVGPANKPFDGYVSTDDPTNTAPNVLVRGSQNVYKNLSQQVVNRCGLKRRGTGDPTEDGVVATYEWYDSLGRTIPVRVLASGKWQFESNIVDPDVFVWYDLLTGLTDTRFIFSPWWDDVQQKDILTGVNGTSNIYAWSGGLTQYASSSTATGGRIWSLTGGSSTSGSYVAGDILTIAGGATPATFEVLAADGGIPSQIRMISLGSGYVAANGVATTGGSGSNFTVDITEVRDTYTLTKEGTDTWAEDGFLVADLVSNVAVEFIFDMDTAGEPLVINGVDFIYAGGEDTTTLTYVSGDPSATAGDVLYQGVRITANTPATGFTNDLSIVFNNQLIIGSYSSRLVYASSNTDYTDFTEVVPFFEGLPFILTLDDTVKGFAIRQGNLQISAGLSDWYEIVLSTTNISGTTYANIAVNKKPGATLSAALGQEFISNNGDDIYYVAQDHQLYVYGAFTNQFSQRFPALSQAIRDELKDEDFTGGALRWVNDSLYLSSITSGKTYTYSARQFVDPNGNIVAERLWYPPQIWNISRICVIDGVIYGASSENPQYYQLFDTGQFHDDTPTSTVAPYECVARWAYWNSGKRTKLVDLDKIYLEGYLATNSPLTLRLRDDYLASTAYQEAVVSALDDNPTLFTDSGVVPIGTGVGSHTIGGEGLDEFGNPQLPKFRAIMTFERHNVFEFQFELYSYDADSQWAILAIGTNASQVVNNPVFIQKS